MTQILPLQERQVLRFIWAVPMATYSGACLVIAPDGQTRAHAWSHLSKVQGAVPGWNRGVHSFWKPSSIPIGLMQPVGHARTHSAHRVQADRNADSSWAPGIRSNGSLVPVPFSPTP
jgi:hypothetical protein